METRGKLSGDGRWQFLNSTGPSLNMQLSLALVVAMGVLGFACGSDSNLRGDTSSVDSIFGRNLKDQFNNCRILISCPTGCPGGICYKCDEGTCTCGPTSSKCGYCGAFVC